AYQKLFVDGNKQGYNQNKGGLVQLDFIVPGSKTDEDELYGNTVLGIIGEVLAKNYSLKDMCILTRKKKQGMFLAEFLMQTGIPIISSESLLLNSSPKVRFLVQLL